MEKSATKVKNIYPYTVKEKMLFYGVENFFKGPI